MRNIWEGVATIDRETHNSNNHNRNEKEVKKKEEGYL
jgi:hypothetical protein